MKPGTIIATFFFATLTLHPRSLLAQPSPRSAPIYEVTVVERSVKAVNYEYNSEPTNIEFRGTALLPRAKGEATVQSRRGRTEIYASLQGLSAPQQFGGEYLAYVLWAITPEGRPHNLGELLPGPSNKARLQVTTDLQAFALIVTAEPYSAVRQPSDVVVLQNELRPDTAGIVRPVEAKYELLPRGHYTLNKSVAHDALLASGPSVSMHEYESTLALYQARNAIGIAKNAQAARYATVTLDRAESLLAQAQQLHDGRADYSEVVRRAREAAQTAEDARLIAQRREQGERIREANAALTKTQADLAAAQRDRQHAEDEANAAREQARAATVAQAESEAVSARQRTHMLEPGSVDRALLAPPTARDLADQHRVFRIRLAGEMNAILPTLDSPRGLVVSLSEADDAFLGASLRNSASERVGRLAMILAKYPGLRISVEGNSDTAAHASLALQRADTIRRLFLANRLPPTAVVASSDGNRRPTESNATPRGRTKNSRVEIVVSGDPIGTLPVWERPHSLTS
jgi:flagellar motor protein MotB